MASKMQEPFLGKVCDVCGYGTYQLPLSGQEWHLVCDECDTIMFCYEPLPHQERFHADGHRIKMFAGGYGSGKTATTCAETIDHILSTPRGTTLIGAATLPQLEQTAQKEFFEMFPQELVANYSKQKNYLDTTNGHRVIFRPLDDEGKARSLNLSFAWIEEASEVKYDYFVQLQTRLRNRATDKHQIVLSTNPDMNWVKTEVLLKAHVIHNTDVEYHRSEINDNISVHIAPTELNTHLPPNFLEDTARGKAEWWIKRFLYGSFENKEGLVYPQAMDNIVDDFEIPKHWKRYMGVDFGLVDPTVAVWGAVNPRTGVLYLYDEHYQNQKPVSYHAEQMLKRLDLMPYGVMNPPVGDSKGKAANEKDMRSLFDHYAEYGIYFLPGTRKLEDSIMKMFGYFELGKIKIFKSLKNTIWEFENYKYPERELDTDKKINYEIPLDKNNHACFIAGTLIETDNGLVPIEDIKIGDKVRTRKGFRKVYDSALTGVNREVYRVDFSNGSHIIATSNHPIYVENKGFLAIDSLRYSDTIIVSDDWEELKCQKSILSNGTVKSGEDTLNQNTQVIEDTISQKDVGYTERNGSISMEKYLKGSMYTIKTTTQKTMKLKTLKLSKRQNTFNTMLRKVMSILSLSKKEKNSSKEYDQRQRIGIGQKKVESGIENMLLIQSEKGLKKIMNLFVKTAEKILSTTTQALSFVPITASLHGEENKGWMMKKESASSVIQNSQLINTEKRKPVQENVLTNYVLNDQIKECVLSAEGTMSRTTPIRKHVTESVTIVGIRKLEERHNVYNISVEGEHEYFANGVLSHNCDAVRYMVAELPDDPSDLINLSYNANFEVVNSRRQRTSLPHALQREERNEVRDWLNYY